MRKANEIKSDLIETLASEGDGPMRVLGFNRNKRSIEYVRVVGDVKHVLLFHADYNPRWSPDSEAHLHPGFRVKMPSVCERVVELLDGDRNLFVPGEDTVLGGPIQWAAPKGHRREWYATGIQEIANCVRNIVAFAKTWVIPLLDEFTGPQSLIDACVGKDSRYTTPIEHHLLVAAALDLAGARDQARQVLEEKASALAYRERYAAVFRNLERRD